MSATGKRIELEVVTPGRIIFTGQVDSMSVDAAKGNMGIFPMHTPMLALLKPGYVKYSSEGTSGAFKTSDGFLEISKNKVRVIVESAEATD